ncbi:MarR family winged helix-turn-helix transcriptional regulator [Actinokineospora bangkokensis]|uniref:HTH marR-type domain-containing protein n=1 Tax=Actinokineospora bangkokensis TaxID=1193682 RepID=A0A1Q9LQB4_9PSEU|nr:MarR family transcriptional regulator [Actinokineospora bangkokensis]OLR91084.1 hypothetical protein BJP25_31620 [Actinokineospora bangkokensis]OLR94183.1 hypothetical protein BJP25_10300 [Actinokineospora bangkokensis]
MAAPLGPVPPGPDRDDPADHTRLEADASALTLVLAKATASVYPKVPAAQLRALQFIGDHEPVNLTRLTEELGTIPSSASRICDRLQASGLLDRRPATTDRREVELLLTSDGRSLLHRLKEARREGLAHILDAMPAPARTALLHGLSEFAAIATPTPQPHPHRDTA